MWCLVLLFYRCSVNCALQLFLPIEQRRTFNFPFNMDAFMDVDELFHLRNLFYQGAYDQVIADTTPQGKPLVIRALIAKGDISKALSEIESLSPPSPALKLLAQYEAAKSAGDKSTVAEKALAIDAADSTSLVALGTILYNESQFEDALKVLNKHEQNLEA